MGRQLDPQVTTSASLVIKKREEISSQVLNQVKDPDAWKFGVKNKSHYAFNERGDLIGCANVIFLFLEGKHLVFFFDSVEIASNYRNQGIGRQLVKYCLDEVWGKHDNALIFLLVVGCDQARLKFFSQFQFQIIDKRINVRGEHCLMTFPVITESRTVSMRIFEFFKWQIDHKAEISSDCTYAHNKTTVGLYWCEKKQIFVSGLEKQTCPYYVKGSTLVSKEKEF